MIKVGVDHESCNLIIKTFPNALTRILPCMVQYVGSTKLNTIPRSPLACRPAKPINVYHKVLLCGRFEPYVNIFLLYSIPTKRSGRATLIHINPTQSAFKQLN